MRGPARGERALWPVACLNFQKSRVGALSMFHIAVIVVVENLTKGCRLSRFHFKCCRHFLGHVACRKLQRSVWDCIGLDPIGLKM